MENSTQPRDWDGGWNGGEEGQTERDHDRDFSWVVYVVVCDVYPIGTFFFLLIRLVSGTVVLAVTILTMSRRGISLTQTLSVHFL